MEDIINRIREIRQTLGLNQNDFAEALNLKRNSITQIETGRRNPSDRTLLDICKEFNVNENWLRTGKGEMFIQLDREDEITKWLGSLMNPNNNNEFVRKFVHMLSKLEISDWEVLEKMSLLMLEEDKDGENY